MEMGRFSKYQKEKKNLNFFCIDFTKRIFGNFDKEARLINFLIMKYNYYLQKFIIKFLIL